MRESGTASVMVGRSTELRTLLDALRDGRDGRPRTLLVRGEAGVGKTRLVQEMLARWAVERDPALPLAIAVGQCVDLGPIGAPFGPIRRVLRDLHAEVGAEALRAAAGSPAGARALAVLVPGVADDGGSDDEHVGGVAETVEVVLESLSATHHVVIVIEDLQWADAATFALLKTLASTLRGRHLTVVATYRSDDIDRFHPLHPVLAELDRTRGLVRVDVRPLSAAEVAEQVTQLRGGEGPGPADIELLAERSGGIPFLVEELVDLGDRRLPDTLRDLVLARYTRLTSNAQETARVMAAGGVHVDHDVLAAVSPLGERALDLALREAIDTRVIIALGAGYAFRHALTREAVEGEMLPSERVRVHRRYAEHLREHRADSLDDASAIAEHWLAARDLPAAFDATVTALRHSRARFSPATSAKLAERLTELWDQVPDAGTRASATLAQLHLATAEAWHHLGDAERALRAANEGLAVCPDDPVTRAALLRQRFVQVYNSEYTSRRDDLDEAARLLAGRDDTEARALLSRVMTNIALGEHGKAAAEHLAQAITLAEDAGDPAGLAVALTTEAWRIAEDEDDEPAARQPLDRAAALRLDPGLRAFVGSAQTDLLVRLGRFDEAAVVGAQHYEDAARAGIERGSGTSIAHSLAFALFASGRPGEALQYARRARRLEDRPGRASAVRLLATHLSWNDQSEERAALLAREGGVIDEAMRRYPEKGDWWAIDRGESMLTVAGSDDSPDAADAMARLLAVAVGSSEDDAVEPRLPGEAAPAVRRYAAITAGLLARPGAPGAAAALHRVRDAAARWPRHGTAPRYAAFVEALLADAEGDAPEKRAARWTSVLSDPTDGALPIWHRQIARCRLAAALLPAGDREAAAELLAVVAAEAPGQGVARVARWAQQIARDAGLGDGAGGTDAGAGAIAALTPRERQVLELVAEGLTNAQIGRRLFISPKTASVHVSAILAKIGAANRAEAAALYTAALAS